LTYALAAENSLFSALSVSLLWVLVWGRELVPGLGLELVPGLGLVPGLEVGQRNR